MFTAADLCVFLGFLYAFGAAHGNAVTYDTDATKILNPPEQYWLFRQNNNSDTSFTSRNRCVLIEYFAENDTSGMVVLSASNHVRNEHWESAMYSVSVDSSLSDKGDVLRYEPLDEDGSTGTYYYKVLHVVQSLCYIVEMVSKSEKRAQKAQADAHNCELWIKKDKEVRHQRKSVNVTGMAACKEALDALCDRRAVYWKRLCDPISG
uniref:Putative secreted protein n=1 Tax=Amblyomma cajennense TaxID=34607 RepID=A0A023FQY3_AMBCJ